MLWVQTKINKGNSEYRVILNIGLPALAWRRREATKWLIFRISKGQTFLSSSLLAVSGSPSYLPLRLRFAVTKVEMLHLWRSPLGLQYFWRHISFH